jgi:hypothetical protein
MQFVCKSINKRHIYIYICIFIYVSICIGELLWVRNAVLVSKVLTNIHTPLYI